MGLDGVELIMAVEEEFQIQISDSEAEECFTVEKLVDVVMSKFLLKDAGNREVMKEKVFRMIRRITSEQLGVDESEITLETDYVKDLGC